MNKKVLMMLIIAAVNISGCSTKINDTSEYDIEQAATEDEVKQRQLELEYLSKVEFSESNKDEIEKTVSSLVQAYIGKLCNRDELCMEVSDSVWYYFNSTNNEYEQSEYYEEAENIIKNDEQYTVSVDVSYSRDCAFVIVSYPSSREMLKITYNDKIEDITRYR